MSSKSKTQRAKEPAVELRGVIDQIEGDIVVVAFDDEQTLDWPRRFVPEEAKSGDAVIVRVVPVDATYWSGEIAAGSSALSIEIDAADTAARKERVRGLIDDIFKKK